MNSVFRLVIFIFFLVCALFTGFIAYESTQEFRFNLLQLVSLGILTVPLIIATSYDENTTGMGEDDETVDLSERDPKADLKVVQDMAERMLKSINEHIPVPCTVMGFKTTEVTYEIEWLINPDDFLKSYQEIAIIPYEKVHDLEYWQEITRIIIRNNKVKSNRKQASQQKAQATKRSRTKSE